MGPRIAWYGDDFTGATDTLATLTQAGLRAILFLDVPTLEQQSRAGDALGGELDAIGIAGATRAMAPAQIARTLAPVASYFASLRPDVLHYKVCSTFDSSPQVGNIAAAVRALRPYVGNPLVPIVAGQPNLGRYCAFSNLFASAGAGREVQRLDRHPTMRNHPVTPMREADLRRHLELQGLQPLAALHYPLYSQPKDVQDAAVARAIESGAGGLLMDVADASHLAAAGRILWRQAGRGRVLAVGSSVVA
jgi:3-oxoisoapionate kinase